jgi:hypothetical protein
MVGTHRDITFNIKNTGGGTLEGTLSERCPDFSIVSGGGNFRLGTEDTREVTIRFQPVSSGAKTCVVSVGTGPCVGVRCTGNADPGPECRVVPASLDFDSVQVGSYKDLSIEIENTGGGMLEGQVSESCDDFSVTSGEGGYSLEPGSKHYVSVRFAPTSVGTKTCLVDLGGDWCAAVSCAGTGTPGAECRVTPDTLEFGSVRIGTFLELTLLIENEGVGPLMGNVSEDCRYFSVQSGGGPYSLGAGQTREVTVRFAPTTTAWDTCTVDLGTGICPGVTCTGSGNTGPQCQMILTSLDFGTLDLGAYKDLAFEIRNVGSGTLTGNVSETCDDYSILSGGGAFALSNVEALNVAVRFTPSTTGTISCTIETGTGLCPDVSCTGACVLGPTCRLTPESLDFGDVFMGEYRDLAFEIKNVGGGTLTGEITEDCGSYALVYGGGSFRLASGQSREVMVRFSPSGIGTRTCWVRTGVSDCYWMRCTGVGMWPGAGSGGE